MLKKRHYSLGELISLLMELLNLPPMILLGLFLFGNILKLNDLCFLENNTPQVPPLWDKQIIAVHVDLALYQLDGVVGEVLLVLVCDLDGRTRSPLITTLRCFNRRYEVHLCFLPKPLTMFHLTELDSIGYTSCHFPMSFC